MWYCIIFYGKYVFKDKKMKMLVFCLVRYIGKEWMIIVKMLINSFLIEDNYYYFYILKWLKMVI